MPATWNAEAEARLLLGILAQVQGARLDYKALSDHMGPEYTVPALRQRIFKLRRDAGIPVNSPGKARGAQSPGGAPKTPTKASKRGAPETPTKSTKKPHCVVESDSDDEEMKADVNIIKKKVDKEEEDKKETPVVDLVD